MRSERRYTVRLVGQTWDRTVEADTVASEHGFIVFRSHPSVGPSVVTLMLPSERVHCVELVTEEE